MTFKYYYCGEVNLPEYAIEQILEAVICSHGRYSRNSLHSCQNVITEYIYDCYDEIERYCLMEHYNEIVHEIHRRFIEWQQKKDK